MATAYERVLWTVPEFCAAHGLGTTSVYDMMARGEIDGVKVGRSTRITEDSRQRWLQNLPKADLRPTRKPAAPEQRAA